LTSLACLFIPVITVLLHWTNSQLGITLLSLFLFYILTGSTLCLMWSGQHLVERVLRIVAATFMGYMTYFVLTARVA
jgi:hypothetical protein